MVSYGLMYRYVPESELNERYVLEPNIDTVVNYTEADAKDSKFSSDAAEIIAREIMKSRIMKSAAAVSENNSDGGSTSRNAAKPRKVNKRSAETLMSMDTSAMAAAKKCVSKAKVARDFFGRVIKSETTQKSKNAGDQGSAGAIDDESKENGKKNRRLVNTSKVWFKYQEGFSNAVKRSVKLNEFL